MATSVFNGKIKKVENKMPDFRGLVKKTNYDAKISDIEGRYFITSNYNEFTSYILDAKIKQKVGRQI